MKPFPGWRAVGHAMRWARQQDGVTVGHSRNEFNERVITWWRDTDMVTIEFDRDTYQLSIDGDDNWLTDGHFESAGAVLRVLAALDLIPAHLADAPAEQRYDTCAVCGRTVRLWNDFATPRWVHVKPAAVTGPNAHRAEVAS